MTTTKESGLLAHAHRELDIVDPPGDAAYDGMLRRAVLDVVQVFADQGHSGMSASFAIGALEKLLRYEPLSPLTGEPSEWRDVSHLGGGTAAPHWQNIRCSRVFRRADGTAYDTEGRVFEDADGSRYTSLESHVDVTFPYTPTREVVKRGAVTEPEHAAMDGERPFREQTAGEVGLTGNPR